MIVLNPYDSHVNFVKYEQKEEAIIIRKQY